MSRTDWQTRAYWRRWARDRGAHHYRTRDRWETARFAAVTVSSDPDLQDAFVAGWHDEEQREKTSRPTETALGGEKNEIQPHH
jgi:hypothetical protein